MVKIRETLLPSKKAVEVIAFIPKNEERVITGTDIAKLLYGDQVHAAETEYKRGLKTKTNLFAKITILLKTAKEK